MNYITRNCRLLLILIVFGTVALRAPSMVFTEDTYIGPLNTNYDGQDLVILDCTVTMDGPHTFSSLVLAANGLLTHSFSTNGQLAVAITVTNSPYALNGTTADELANTNIFTPLLLTDPTQTITYTNGVDYLEFIYPYGTYIERTTNSSIPDGGTVLVSYSYYGSVPAGLDLTVTGVVWVAGGCAIDVDDAGYGSGFGPGAGVSSSNMFFFGSGGGYGGSGGMSLSNAVGGVCYDSLYQPSFLGSGGGPSYAGPGGNGGGLVHITAGDEIEIDGVITASGENATNSRSGGGAGGGIYLSAPSVNGVGTITANGGLGAPDYGGGGGGGGRIAIVCGTNNFSGTVAAYGGGGANNGGAGTIFTDLTGVPGFLALNNNGMPGANSTVTLSNLADVAISNGAVLAVSEPFLPQNLTIGTNSILTGQPQTILQFSASSLAISPGGAMSVNGLGGAGSGVGGTSASGGVTYGGGGGHGGVGGAAALSAATGGASYDAEAAPASLGSSGGGGIGFGGAGGGAIRVGVSGMLQIDGMILANGLNGSGLAGGGGAGGSIYLTAGTVTGNGSVTANGGAGANSLGGGGGGGRVEIFANGGTNNFTGTANCYGGGGANYGGAGTVFLYQFGAFQNLVLDNGGNVGPSTPLQSLSGANLFVQDGAWGTLVNGSVYSSLLVTSNSWVTVPASASESIVTIANSATFQAGGGLTLNSDSSPSFPTGKGGSGTSSPYPGGGGGNGGMGGAGNVSVIVQIGDFGGSAGFNSITSPAEPGGNGGGDDFSAGGTGGGAIKLVVEGTLQVNGAIMANGGNGLGEGGGGGAGGSLALSGGLLTGSGSITANGGNGVDSVGGGGGGGCIAITFNSSSFNGTLSAFGGVGANAGGAGTIYFKTNIFANGQIIVDNGGVSGANSVITSLQGTTDLTLRNNGVVSYISPTTLSFGNVLITNASLVISNLSNSPFILNANNLSLQHGGRLSADRGGFAQGSGPGAGKIGQLYGLVCSGGGNAGCGGSAVSNSVVGGSGGFVPFTQATEAGSGGGGSSPTSVGGIGGGVVELNVSGTLAVNGALSANGGNGSGSGGGGGAGGSLQLDVGSLTGSGSISANGGSGADTTGGGGGGGIIALTFEQSTFSNLFTGTMTAYGGGGWTNGGAGTIFIKTNSTGLATLILDNGGNLGTNTPITTSSSLDSIQVRNGAVAALTSSVENFSSLLITSNGWVVPNVAQQGAIGEIDLVLQGNATIQAGGGIIADSDGSLQNVGTGHGSSYTGSSLYPCSGGGHGGDGAFGISNLIAGGVTYDSIASPDLGGSGGGGFETFSAGGSGGGIVLLDLVDGGVLQVNGKISANGGNGSGIGGGGGSGGSINVTAGTINGTGSITANGGAGAPGGGGGGGGCIALVSSGRVGTIGNGATNLFLGAISAYGGGGANYGGAGTLYYRTNSNIQLETPGLCLDNGGNVGTNTTLTIGSVIVVIQNGAIGAIPTGTWLPTAVMVLSNSELTSLVGQTTVRAESMTIATGGVFSADGVGYSAQSGPGAGAVFAGVSGGGGHGGYGGGSANGGAAYDSIQLPTLQGSGGANSSIGLGGAGGGALTLQITQGLVVDGRISANGRSGGLNAGGGAGGSIQINLSPTVVTGTISGSGVISANGGAGQDSGGGGAGGRIALPVTSLKAFTGQYSAAGGAGGSPGGAGTVCTISGAGQTLLVNNGGIAGNDTPLSTSFSLPTSPFELDVSGGATVVPLTPLPLLSNLNVSANSTLTMPFGQSQANLSIAVMGNATIAGDLNVDSLGYSLGSGPGAGMTIDDEGSGGGYGGAGGASESGAPGGKIYGSAAYPADFGSGGGNGANTITGGSEGGGALRLSVTGTLNVSGNVSANGDAGLQDDSGGGSGGSVWISAGTLSGAGAISAAGGDGVLYGGGGGGGGRIAIYTIANQFTGSTNVSAGLGIVSGQPGTVSRGSALTGLQILSQSPTGLVMNTVSSVNLTFSDMLNPSSVSASDFTVVTPGGLLSQTSLIVTVSSPYSVQLSFPTQNLVGTYTVEVGTKILDAFGAELAQAYSGTFTVSLPTISGTVTGTNGAGFSGVTMQASGGLTAATTDSNGNYSLGVPIGWTGTVTPLLGSDGFLPGSMSYTNVTGSVTNQNYSIIQSISPLLSASQSAGRWTMTWNGFSGVTYQMLWSTNLVTWQPLGSPISGANGPMEYSMPGGSNSEEFFQLQVTQ